MTDRYVVHPLEQWLTDIGAELIEDPSDDFDSDPWKTDTVEQVVLTIAQQDFLRAVETFPSFRKPRIVADGIAADEVEPEIEGPIDTPGRE